MTPKSIEQQLKSLNIHPDEHISKAINLLFQLIEELYIENEKLITENQKLRDEISLLKGELCTKWEYSKKIINLSYILDKILKIYHL